MKRDLFKNLPSEIFTNILSRLPLQSIARSKCVCKPWLHLLQTKQFATSHLAKSIPTLFLLTPKNESSTCSIFEFEDGQDLESHDLHYNPLTRFDFPHNVELNGSANGLLLLSSTNHYVCNPITREYIEVRFPEELVHPYPFKVFNYPQTLGDSLYSYPLCVTYGFGASKVTGEYKLVRIYHGSVIARQLHGGGGRIIPQAEVHVHTIGTESWRSVQPGVPFDYSPRTRYVFLNGSLHWIVADSESKLWISCFDLETECFTSFATPPLHQESFEVVPGLSVLGGHLCLCDHTRECETVIWLMKKYGVEESWTKEYAFDVNGGEEGLDIEGFELIYPLKVFNDGDMLMLREDLQLFYYSTKTQTALDIGIFGEERVSSILLAPSFFSLKGLGMENVVSFSLFCISRMEICIALLYKLYSNYFSTLWE